MAKTIILPSALKYQTIIANSVSAISSIKGIGSNIIEDQTKLLNNYSNLILQLNKKIAELEDKLNSAVNIHGDDEKQADAYCNSVLPAMNELREVVDMLEVETDDECWVLPKYREMLFIF